MQISLNNISRLIITGVGQVHIINPRKNILHGARHSFIHKRQHSLSFKVPLCSLMHDLHLKITGNSINLMFPWSVEHYFLSFEHLIPIRRGQSTEISCSSPDSKSILNMDEFQVFLVYRDISHLVIRSNFIYSTLPVDRHWGEGD
jgi:hypothetical protein